jgi:hypothetical protein
MIQWKYIAQRYFAIFSAQKQRRAKVKTFLESSRQSASDSVIRMTIGRVLAEISLFK